MWQLLPRRQPLSPPLQALWRCRRRLLHPSVPCHPRRHAAGFHTRCDQPAGGAALTPLARTPCSRFPRLACWRRWMTSPPMQRSTWVTRRKRCCAAACWPCPMPPTCCLAAAVMTTTPTRHLTTVPRLPIPPTNHTPRRVHCRRRQVVEARSRHRLRRCHVRRSQSRSPPGRHTCHHCQRVVASAALPHPHPPSWSLPCARRQWRWWRVAVGSGRLTCHRRWTP